MAFRRCWAVMGRHDVDCQMLGSPPCPLAQPLPMRLLDRRRGCLHPPAQVEPRGVCGLMNRIVMPQCWGEDRSLGISSGANQFGCLTAARIA